MLTKQDILEIALSALFGILLALVGLTPLLATLAFIWQQ